MRIDIRNLEFIDKTLGIIVTELEEESGVELTITSLYRIGDGGVHGQLPVRGIDVRMKLAMVGAAIEKHINDKWEYDPQRPHKKCAIYHNVGKGVHLHIQSHYNTVRRSL